MNRNKITSYIYAKDNNKPHLMKDVFTKFAKLDIKLNSNNISFPSETIGLEEITTVLVNDFNKTYENVYTLCLEDTFEEKENTIQCKWFVIMTDKTTKEIRVGYGLYLWHFNNKHLVNKLNITIEKMIILETMYNNEIFNWIKQLPYPWCDNKIAYKNMPTINELSSLFDMIKNNS